MVSNEGRKTEGEDTKLTPLTAEVNMPDLGKLTIAISDNAAEESKSACPLQRTTPENSSQKPPI